MFKNYLKIAIRHLIKNNVFSLINILGLTLGFTSFILLALFVHDELSFDRFHQDADQIYRVVQTINEQDGSSRKVATIAPLVGTEAQKQFPEVIAQTQLIQIGRLTVGNEPLNRDYERIWIADANFFSFFDFDPLYGNPQQVLHDPNNIAITESKARKYFGRADVVGEALYTNRFEAKVAAVVKDFPANSHINVNIIHAEPTWAREIKSWNQFVTTDWTSNSFITYLKMRPEFNKAAFEQKLTTLVTSNYTEEEVKYTSTFELQPLTDIHLHSRHIEGGLNAHAGNPLYIYIFSIVAFLILAIACFNYMNLSTAAGSRRTRELAMRKTLGAMKQQLVLQFFGEAILLSLLSLIFALMLITLILPHINDLLQKQILFPVDNLPLFFVLIGAVLFSGILSALYPALYLSKVQPVTAFRDEIKIGGGTFSVRKILVVAQFAISIGMIASTMLIYQQLNYLEKKELGFQVENLLVVDINSGNLRSQFESIKQEFESLPEVKSVTVSSRVPGEWKVFPIANVEHPPQNTKSQMIFIGTDKDFLKTYNIKLLQGRMLRNDIADSNAVLLSASAVKALGVVDPIGKTVDINGTVWAGDFAEDDKYSPTVIGVVEDFYFQSFREEMRPVMLASYRNPIHNIDYYTLRVQTGHWQETMAKLQAINFKFDPENPMEYNFLDDRFTQFYQPDRRRGELFLIFSGLIIFIACMGLFALASFAIENRIKEIGVRKVLGANVSQIAWLLSSEFAVLVGIAFLLSVPLAYWAVQNWLQEFAYRISVPWWVFPAAGFVALFIALSTISYQTIRAAHANPVESLRNE